MASYETLQKLQEHPEWIAPRSDTRVFLGEPCAPEATKTTIEPGNAFSPGMGTFGVAWWLRFPQDGAFYAPERASIEELKWRFEEGYLPLIHCDTSVNGIAIHHSLFQDGIAAERSEAVCAEIRLENLRSDLVDIQLFVTLRSLGPAGGPVYDLKVGSDHRSFWLSKRDLPLMGVDLTPTLVGCGIGDPSPLAQQGQVPVAQEADEEDGWCFGLMRFDIHLSTQEGWSVHIDCPQQSYGVLQNALPGKATFHPECYQQRAQAHLESWLSRMPDIELEVPDEDFRNAFFANLQHMLIATVGDQVRLAPLAYPLPWLRDGVFIMRCFDLAGWHELARATSKICVRQDFYGGFCAEADGPGEGIWALVEHYRITHDRGWLESIYPSIQRKCDWLFSMRRAKEPIQIVLDTPVLPFMHFYRNAGVICLPTQNGLIMGVMDHQVREGQTNHWALCGLQEAAYAARELNRTEDTEIYEQEIEELRTALARFVDNSPQYFEWERNTNSLLWPTRAWEYDLDKVAPGFKAWWRECRGTETEYIPEKWWLHFEFGQIHNALLLGLREQVWTAVKYRLDHQDTPGLYGWREFGGGFEAAGNAVNGVSAIQLLRGCQRFDQITPHGWCASEMWLLQRGMLVEEWRGELRLFAGIPKIWLKPGAHIAFRNMLTWYGKVSAEMSVDQDGKTATVRVSGIEPGTQVKVELPGAEALVKSYPSKNLHKEEGICLLIPLQV